MVAHIRKGTYQAVLTPLSESSYMGGCHWLKFYIPNYNASIEYKVSVFVDRRCRIPRFVRVKTLTETAQNLTMHDSDVNY